MRRLAAAALTALLACGTASAEDVLLARGHEPSWQLSMSGAGLYFEAPGLGLAFAASGHRREIAEGPPRIVAERGSDRLEMTITESICADTMTGMPFPIGVVVSFGGQRFQGCGGDIMTAIEGGWRVIRIGDELLPQGVIATIVIDREGRVSGRSGCNRFTGSYTLSGEGLSFGTLAVTRMACPPPQMELEKRFLELMPKITRATPGDNGQLRLMAGDKQAMVLDRAD